MFRRLSGTFLAGIFALLPLIVTLAIIGFIVGKLNDWMGPNSAFGQLFATPGEEGSAGFNLTFYILTFVLAILIILIIGYFARKVTGQRMGGWINHLISKIPFINKVYHSVEQVVGLVNQGDSDSVGALSNVVFARIANTRVIGMLSSSAPVQINGVPHYLVYFPSTPVPATGFNYLIPCDEVEDADISVEEMTKVLLSLGSLGPDIMNQKNPLILDKPRHGPQPGLQQPAD